MRQMLLVLPLATALGACHGTPLPYEESPYSVIPAGAQLTLHRDLTIPAGWARLYIQGGGPRPYSDVNPYHPHCRLEVERVREVPQTVKADVFRVEKVVYEELPWPAGGGSFLPASVPRAGLIGAVGIEAREDLGRGAYIAGSFGVADGSSPWTYATHFRLRSERQPEVRRLTCQHWNDPTLAVHLTIRQIRETLGDLFTLEIRAERAETEQGGARLPAFVFSGRARSPRVPVLEALAAVGK